MKEYLLNRLKEVEALIQNCISQHHAAQGAKHEILNLLQKIHEEEAKTKEEPPKEELSDMVA